MISFSHKVLIVVLPLLLGNIAVAGDYTFTTGAEYTEGDYGTSIDTSTLYIPFKFGYNTEQYAWSVTVPYVRISGSEDVVFSTTTHSPMFSTTSTSSVEHTDSGLGDIIFSGTYQLQEETKASPWLALTGEIKLATASESKKLGTGENDYALQLELAKQAVHGFVGYKIVGDSAAIDYDNVLYAAVGITIPASSNWTTITELYTEQAALAGVDGAREISFTLSKPLTDKKQFSIYMIKGLTNSSPDWGMGVTLSHRL